MARRRCSAQGFGDFPVMAFSTPEKYRSNATGRWSQTNCDQYHKRRIARVDREGEKRAIGHVLFCEASLLPPALHRQDEKCGWVAGEMNPTCRSTQKGSAPRSTIFLLP